MNYVERHFGDWARDTAHLSMLEDGAYNRLCDLYYVRETPLPADLAGCCRLVRAVSKPERDAVKSVLAEFFYSTDEGWRHKRCDQEIERFRTKSGKASASAKARWSAQPSQSDGNADASANASPDAMRTHSEGNATRERGRARSHSPLPKHQTPTSESVEPPPQQRAPEEAPPEVNGHDPTQAGMACKAMRQAGLQSTNPSDPRLLALLEQGATVAEFAGVAAEAFEKRKGWAWVLAVVAARRNEANEIALAPAIEADPMAWSETRDGVINRACALALEPYDGIGNWQKYRRHVIEEDARRQTA